MMFEKYKFDKKRYKTALQLINWMQYNVVAKT